MNGDDFRVNAAGAVRNPPGFCQLCGTPTPDPGEHDVCDDCFHVDVDAIVGSDDGED